MAFLQSVLAFIVAIACLDGYERFVVATGQHVFPIVGHCPLLPVVHHPVHLLVRDESAVYPGRHPGTGREIKHIAMAEELFGTSLIEDGP